MQVARDCEFISKNKKLFADAPFLYGPSARPYPLPLDPKCFWSVATNLWPVGHVDNVDNVDNQLQVAWPIPQPVGVWTMWTISF